MKITTEHINAFKQKTAEEQVAFLNDRLLEIRGEFNNSIYLLRGKLRKAESSPYLYSRNPLEKQIAELKMKKLLDRLKFLEDAKNQCLQPLVELATYSKKADFKTFSPLLSKNYNFKKLYSTLQHGLFEKDFFQVFSKCFQSCYFEELFNFFYQNLKFGFDESIQQKEEELKQIEEKLELINKNANNEDIPDIENISLYSENIKKTIQKIEKEKDKFELEIVVSLFKLLTFFSLKEISPIIKNI